MSKLRGSIPQVFEKRFKVLARLLLLSSFLAPTSSTVSLVAKTISTSRRSRNAVV